MINYSYEKPEEVTVGNHLGQKQRTINFNITQMGENEYKYCSVSLGPGIWNYEAIVSALVNEIYPNDKMQAVINNYLLEPEDADIKKEFLQMQDWRKESKEIAKRLLEAY